MVDIPRPDIARSRQYRRLGYVAGAAAVVSLISLGIFRLQPAPPSVDRRNVYVATVEQGQMLRDVRGSGTLIPEEIRWISAVTNSTVERIVLRPGVSVQPDTIIVELSNPQLEQSALEARLQLEAAQARYQSRQVALDRELLTQQASVATILSELTLAEFEAQQYEKLFAADLVSELDLRKSQSRVSQLGIRHQIEEQRLEIQSSSIDTELAAVQAEVDRLQTIYALRQSEVASLQLTAGVSGVLQEVPLEEGARVTPGTNLARVGNPARLKAALRVAETQARDIQIGQPATIDTRNGIIPGRVRRIDPAVQEGTVTVDITLDGKLPRGARPDLTVDGRIELERLEDVVYMGRPAFGQAGSAVSLFKLEPDSHDAIRTRVQLGRSSVNTIEVIEGLQPGDQVVLSDMSQWDAFDRVRLQ